MKKANDHPLTEKYANLNIISKKLPDWNLFGS